MGWGKNSQADSNGQDIMKQVSLNLLENGEKCAKDLIATNELSYIWKPHKSMICANPEQATDNDNNLCNGDGGGPLVCHQIGLGNRYVSLHYEKDFPRS